MARPDASASRFRFTPALKRRIAGLLAFVLTMNPLLVIADAFDDAVQDGKNASADYTVRMPTFNEVDGQITIDYGGSTQSMSLSTLFGPERNLGLGPSNADISATYGDEGAAMAMGAARQGTLEGENSAQGEAYRAMIDSANIGKPDLSGDPIWGLTDQVTQNAALFAGFDACTEVPDIVDVVQTEHVPDYRICERSGLITGECQLTHNIDVGDPPVSPVITVTNWSAVPPFHPGGTAASLTYEGCGRGCWRIGVVEATCDPTVGDTPECQPGLHRLDFWIPNAGWLESLSVQAAGTPPSVVTHNGDSIAWSSLTVQRFKTQNTHYVSMMGGFEMIFRYDPTRGISRGTRFTGGQSCGEGCWEVVVEATDIVDYAPDACQNTSNSTSFSINQPSKVISAQLTFVNFDQGCVAGGGSCSPALGSEAMSVSLDTVSIWSSPAGAPDDGTFSGTDPNFCQPLDNLSQQVNYAGVDVTNIIKSGQDHTLRLYTEDRVGDTRNRAVLRMYYDTSGEGVFHEYWDYGEQCDALYEAAQACPGGVVECTAQFNQVADDLYYVAPDFYFNLNDFLPAPYGLPRECKEARIVADCSSVYEGNLDCYFDAQGVERCPTNDGLNQAYDAGQEEWTNCQVYEQDPSCSYVGSQPVEGALEGAGGQTLVREDIYDCGFDVEVVDQVIGSTIDCAGVPIRCMGGDCIDINPEKSTSFNEVVAGLHLADEMAGDSDCPDENPGLCEIFKGERLRCKKAFFGFVNCCEKPDNVSFLDYMKLYKASRNLDDLMGTGAFGVVDGVLAPIESAAEGAWNKIASGAESVYSAIQTPFTSAEESAAAAGSMLDSASLKAAYEGFKQAAMKTAAEFVGTTFGADAGSLIFQNTAGDTLYEASGALVPDATVAFSAGFQQMLTVINWAITIYTIVTILVQLIWECEESEFELGAKQQFKLCHYVGTYCASDVVGVCIEKKETHCCYNSPLSRIVNEQVRLQDVLDWGSAKDPNCSGLTPLQLGQVDWEQVDLSEWIALLNISDSLPKAVNIDVESLTGAGSVLDLDASVPRPNAIDRTVDRQDTTLTESGKTPAEMYQESLSGAGIVTPAPVPDPN